MPLELNRAKLDADRVDGGVWWKIDLLPDGRFVGVPLREKPESEPAVLVRPQGIEWDRALAEAQRPHLPEIRDRKLSTEDERRIVGQAAAKALWRGAVNLTVGGKPLEWSEEVAAKMLGSVEWLGLCEFIVEAARDRAALLAREEEKAAGN